MTTTTSEFNATNDPTGDKALKAAGFRRPEFTDSKLLKWQAGSHGRRIVGVYVHDDGTVRIGVQGIDQAWTNITVSPKGTVSSFRAPDLEASAAYERAEGTL
jgi:hypothetical protein